MHGRKDIKDSRCPIHSPLLQIEKALMNRLKEGYWESVSKSQNALHGRKPKLDAIPVANKLIECKRKSLREATCTLDIERSMTILIKTVSSL